MRSDVSDSNDRYVVAAFRIHDCRLPMSKADMLQFLRGMAVPLKVVALRVPAGYAKRYVVPFAGERAQSK
jgi:hypothetical protein